MQLSTRSAVARSTQAYCALISEAESLSCGVAFRCQRFPQLSEGNQIREVIVSSADEALIAFEAVDGYFASFDLECHRWAPTIDADPAILETLLVPRGFVRQHGQAMLLKEWPAANDHRDLRILPARPMRDAYQATYVDAVLAFPNDPDTVAEAALDRLDEASLDMFVAVLDGKPVGRGGLFMVGDIGRVVDVAVLPEWRGQGVGTAVMRHLLMLAKRLMPRIVCAAIDSDNPASLALLNGCGLVADGEMVEFHRKSTPANP